MPELPREKINQLNPVIGQFDEQNGLLEYVHAQTVGAPEFDIEMLKHDVLDVYFGGIRIVRKEHRLRRFVRDCGELIVESAVQRDSPMYERAAKFAGADPADLEASGQLDEVIAHFAAHTKVFDRLYGTLDQNKPAKKPKKRGGFVKAAVLELPADFPANRVPLRKRDLPQRPDNDETSQANEAFLNYAVTNNGFRFEEAKRARAIKRHFDEVALKEQFPDLRQAAVEILHNRGVEAGWDEYSKARGKRYFITQELKEPVVKTRLKAERPEPAINKFVSHVVIRRTVIGDVEAEAAQYIGEVDPKELVIFNDKLGTYARDYIAMVGGKVTTNQLARDMVIRMESEITFNEARRAIAHLIQGESIFRGQREGGMGTVTNQPVERTNKKGKHRDTSEAEKLEDRLTIDDMSNAQKVLEALRNAGHRHPGLKVSNLAIDTGIDSEELRPFVRKLVKAGVLVRAIRSLPGGAQSRGKQIMFVAFKDQSLWDRYKNDPGSFMKSMLEQ